MAVQYGGDAGKQNPGKLEEMNEMMFYLMLVLVEQGDRMGQDETG